MIALIIREWRAARFWVVASAVIFAVAYTIFGLTMRDLFLVRQRGEVDPSVIGGWLIVVTAILSERIFARESAERRRRGLALLPLPMRRVAAAKFIAIGVAVVLAVSATAVVRLGIHAWVFKPKSLRCEFPDPRDFWPILVFVTGIVAFAGTLFPRRIGALGGGVMIILALAGVLLVLYREWLAFADVTPIRMRRLIPTIMMWTTPSLLLGAALLIARGRLHRPRFRRVFAVAAAGFLIGGAPGIVRGGIAWNDWMRWDDRSPAAAHLLTDVVRTAHGTYAVIQSWNDDHLEGEYRYSTMPRTTLRRLDDGKTFSFGRGEWPRFLATDEPWVEVLTARCRLFDVPNFDTAHARLDALDGTGKAAPEGRLRGSLLSASKPFLGALPDGRRVVYAYDDLKLHLIDSRGRTLRSWDRSSWSFSIAADGRTFASAREDLPRVFTATCVNVQTGAEIKFALEEKAGAESAPARPQFYAGFSVDTAAGRFAFYSSADRKRLMRRDLLTGETIVLATVSERADLAGRIHATPDGRGAAFLVAEASSLAHFEFAAVGADRTVRLAASPVPFHDRTFSPDGAYMLSMAKDYACIVRTADGSIVAGRKWPHLSLGEAYWAADHELIIGDGKRIDGFDPLTGLSRKIFPL